MKNKWKRRNPSMAQDMAYQPLVLVDTAQLTCGELAGYSRSLGWIDVCKGWQEPPEAQV